VDRSREGGIEEIQRNLRLILAIRLGGRVGGILRKVRLRRRDEWLIWVLGR
jgi:hypothetical protein